MLQNFKERTSHRGLEFHKGLKDERGLISDEQGEGTSPGRRAHRMGMEGGAQDGPRERQILGMEFLRWEFLGRASWEKSWGCERSTRGRGPQMTGKGVWTPFRKKQEPSLQDFKEKSGIIWLCHKGRIGISALTMEVFSLREAFATCRGCQAEEGISEGRRLDVFPRSSLLCSLSCSHFPVTIFSR